MKQPQHFFEEKIAIHPLIDTDLLVPITASTKSGSSTFCFRTEPARKALSDNAELNFIVSTNLH